MEAKRNDIGVLKARIDALHAANAVAYVFAQRARRAADRMVSSGQNPYTVRDLVATIYDLTNEVKRLELSDEDTKILKG